MSDQSQILIQALKDRFSAESPAQGSELPDVITAKNPNGPTLLRIPGTDSYEPLEKPRHPDSMSLEEKEQIKVDAERRQQERVAVAKKLAERIEGDHYKALCDGQLPPNGPTGRPAVTFLADLKNVFAPPTNGCLAEHPEFLQMSMAERAIFLKASPDYVDWKLTYGLRLKILEGFENQKSARVRALAPVPDDEILKAAESAVNPKGTPIRNNRFVHSEK